MINLQSTDFELLNVPTQFAQDLAQLDAARKALLREVHPDRFVAEGPAMQRLAMQWSVRINEAYQRLKDPLERGAYLCELNGEPIQAESNTAMPPDFLMQQMEWREALDEATDAAALQALARDVQQQRELAEAAITTAIDQQQDHAAASTWVRKLMFIHKFAQEVRQHQLRLPG